MSLRKNKPRLLRRAGKWMFPAAAALWFGLLLLSAIFPFPVSVLQEARDRRSGMVIVDTEGCVLREFPGRDGSRMIWTPLREISPHVIKATVAVEDARFAGHSGVDPFAVGRALWCNIASGKRISGASTITMQVIRLLEQRPRTLESKIVEAFRATQLESLMDKDEILEWYLNLAPYGGALVGVESASLAWFNKHSRDLTLAEAALIAGLPQSPARLRPDAHAGAARRRRDAVLRRMLDCGLIGEAEYRAAAESPVILASHRGALEAPHFTQMIHDLPDGGSRRRSTLDRRIQAVAESAVRSMADRLRPEVTNGAAVVIENRSGAVRALVGSRDFFSEVDEGQVNGATAPRSPGSALKPFTYALAFDQGICAPETMLADLPVHFDGYTPRNYDLETRGPVTAREALATSLNIPAIRLLREVGQERLYSTLKDLGFSTLTRSAETYGLALTLGSVDVTLIDLTNGYATLARRGLFLPWRLLETEGVSEGTRVFSRGAAYLVSDILADTGRLDAVPQWRQAWSRVKMAWKTGTSYGHKDAWAVAYTPDYTVGVWMGNFDGRPARELVGISAAAPVAATIMDKIFGGRAASWFEAPPDVRRGEVCAVSGMAASEHCAVRREALLLEGRTSKEPCAVHQMVAIDRRTGARLCRSCMDGRTHDLRLYEIWPADVAGWLREMGRGDRVAPPHFSPCSGGDSGRDPRIVSPLDRQTYLFVEERKDQQLRFQAVADSDKIYWFVDGELYAVCAPSEALFWPVERGRHEVVCSDAGGRSSSIAIEVK